MNNKNFILTEDNKQRIYNKALGYKNTSKYNNMLLAKKLFIKLDDYLDSKSLVEECDNFIKHYEQRKTRKKLVVALSIISFFLTIIFGTVIYQNVDHKFIIKIDDETKIVVGKFHKGDALPEIQTPTKEGYVFDGWKWNTLVETKMPNHRYVLKAKWIEKGKVVHEFKNQYVYLGDYPQTKVKTGSETYEKLLKQINDPTVPKKLIDGMNILELNGNRYCEIDKCFYKLEPIKWIVIESDENSYKLISEKVLSTIKYVKDPLAYSSKFYRFSFTDKEKSLIIPSEGSNIEVNLLGYCTLEDIKNKHGLLYKLMGAYPTDFAEHYDTNNGGTAASYVIWYTGFSEILNNKSYQGILDCDSDFYSSRLESDWGYRPVIVIKR